MSITVLPNGRYAKPCPSCGEMQTYLRKWYAEASLKEGKECKKCANSKPENNSHKGYYCGVLRKSFANKEKW